MPSVDIRRPLKKFLPHLLQAQIDNLNEADTVQRLVKVLEEVLGYDTMTEITREKQVKDKYVDLALKIDGTIRLLIEVKSASTILRDRHIDQAESYAAKDNIRWVLLTNGIVWNLYHLTFEEGIEASRAFSVDLSKDDLDRASASLALLHRQAIRKGELDDFWAHQMALNPASLAKSLFSEEALRLIRRDIRRMEEIAVDEEDLAEAIHELFTVEAREQMGPLKIRRKRAPRASGKSTATPATTPNEVLAEAGVEPEDVELT
jgi:predicted type IV restriction endonuclease